MPDFGARKDGVWDPDSVQYEALLGGFSTDMPKGERLQYGSSSATHAMLLTGVHFDADGKADRWKSKIPGEKTSAIRLLRLLGEVF